MKALICPICGGTTTFDVSFLTAKCQYCHTVSALSREDSDRFISFSRRMSRYMAGDDANARADADAFWQSAETREFKCADGTDIGVKYCYMARGNRADMYAAREHVAYQFHSGTDKYLKAYLNAVKRVKIPPNDTRKLDTLVPRVYGAYPLADGETLLVINKSEDEYPAAAFGALPHEHVAWVVSRMENLCCLLEFSGMAHAGVDLNSIFLNPHKHTAALYGGWWAAGGAGEYDASGARVLRMRDQLADIRRAAARLLGCETPEATANTRDLPREFARFLISEPARDAYDDFKLWDAALRASYGRRRFVKLDILDTELYKKEGN